MNKQIQIRALVLAAGKGTRMGANIPKVLHQLKGRPIIGYILDALRQAGVEHIAVVVSPQNSTALRGTLARDITWITQLEQKGTGHAVMSAAQWLKGFSGSLLVLVGDAPLITAVSLNRLIRSQKMQGQGATFLTTVFDDPPPWGRVLRDHDGAVTGIVEDRDASPQEKCIREVSSSHYCFNTPDLLRILPMTGDNNKQGEYYLPDVIGLMIDAGLPVRTLTVDDPMQVFGINTPDDLELAERVLAGKGRG